VKSTPPTPKAGRGVRRVGLITLAAVIAVLLLVLIVTLRHYTNPDYIEKRLSAAMGPDYRVDVGSSVFNPISRRFVAADISIVPDTLSQTVRDGQLRMRYSLGASELRVIGINLWALYHGRIAIASIRVKAPVAEIYLDRIVPGPQETTSSTLPHELLKSCDRPIRIGTIHITEGDLRYSERAVDGIRPGTFQFADLSAMITHVTNDATRMETPCAIEVRTRLADAGQLVAMFECELASKRLNMKYRGSVGAMEALSLNELLVDLEGIRVSGGTIDSTSFSFQVVDDVATGELQVLYHDLGFEVVDKDTLEGLSERFTTFMTNAKRHPSNPRSDEPPLVVTIVREREPHVPLIKFVWETVREGLLSTLDVQ
jgi:hypothetical protein